MLLGLITKNGEIRGECKIEDVIIAGNKSHTVVCGDYIARSSDKVIFLCESCKKEVVIGRRNFFYQHKDRKQFCEQCSYKNTSIERYGLESPNKLASVKLKQHKTGRLDFIDGNENREKKTSSPEELAVLRSKNAKQHWKNGVYESTIEIWKQKGIERFSNSEWKEKFMSIINSRETKLKKSIAAKNLWLNPEYKDKISHMKTNRISGFQKNVYSTLNESWKMEFDIPETTLTVDIYNSNTKEIIECYGDYWHCNPLKFKPDYYHKRMKKTAKEIWEKDGERIKLLESLGYSVKIIWENDWNINKKIR